MKESKRQAAQKKTVKKTAKKVTAVITEKEAQEKPRAQRGYKDTVFCMLFREKKELLSLYNAVNKTAYTEVDKLKVTTLENAVYMNYKNDISFVFDFELMLYEHQSTVNPNMPLRNLIYVTRVLQRLTKDENLYGRELVSLPVPRFVVFYNGTDLQPGQRVMRLSDAYLRKQESPELELTVKIYNINLGYNTELMQECRLLKEYAQYVEQVRVFAKEMPFEEAVEKAVEYCIKNGILTEFLSKNRAEAIAMSIFEYDEEKHMKSEREAAYRLGKKEGRNEGEQRLAQLLQSLMRAGRLDDMNLAVSDQEYRNKLYQDMRL